MSQGRVDRAAFKVARTVATLFPGEQWCHAGYRGNHRSCRCSYAGADRSVAMGVCAVLAGASVHRNHGIGSRLDPCDGLAAPNAALHRRCAECLTSNDSPSSGLVTQSAH